VNTELSECRPANSIPHSFACKFDGRRKERLVARGNQKTVATQEQVYSGVVGIETVQTILARSAMEADLEVVAYLECFLYGKNIENTMIKAG
jgi:hypothetical protein